MIEYSNTSIEALSAHHAGNKTNNEPLVLSDKELELKDTRLRELLLHYFTHPFTEPELFSFTFTDGDFKLNPLYNYCEKIFDHKQSFHKQTVTIAKHLYETAVHPQIKPGDLFVVLLSGVNFEGQETDAIGIFKSENRHPFLQLDTAGFQLEYDEGISIDKLDKACLVFNTEKENGYRVCVVDKSNKSVEAQYWKDQFLGIVQCQDSFHHTQQFLSIAKSFVTDQITEEFEVSRPDQIDLLNRSIGYFKSHQSFDKKEFEKEVFFHPEIIQSFRKYDSGYRDQHALEIDDNFDISSQAVKKQSRVFKSVLKLDRNFHIYIHGDKELIERGVDNDGRKYYKIYYEEES